MKSKELEQRRRTYLSFFSLFFLFFLCSFVMKAQILKFNTKVYDFGTFEKPKGGSSICEFKFLNSGDSPLVINRVVASCGCTTPTWTRQPLAKGDSGFVRIIYHAASVGSFSKTITVYSNNIDGSVRLTVRGVVLPRKLNNKEKYPFLIDGGMRLEEKNLNFLNISKNLSKTHSFEYYNEGKRPISIKAVDVPPYLHVQLSPAVVFPKKKGKVVIAFNGKETDFWGLKDTGFHLLANTASKTNKNKIRIVANVIDTADFTSQKEREKAPRLSYSTRDVDLGELAVGEKGKAKMTITNIGKTPLVIHTINKSSSAIQVVINKNVIQPKKRVTVKIIFIPRLEEDIKDQTIHFITNAPNALNGVVDIHVLKKIRDK